jgi:hypothetical protein
VGVLVAFVLAGGGAWAAAATAAADPTVVQLAPAPTSVDHAPFCSVPDAARMSLTSPGGTAVTFTLVPPGCESD